MIYLQFCASLVKAWLWREGLFSEARAQSKQPGCDLANVTSHCAKQMMISSSLEVIYTNSRSARPGKWCDSCSTMLHGKIFFLNLPSLRLLFFLSFFFFCCFLDKIWPNIPLPSGYIRSDFILYLKTSKNNVCSHSKNLPLRPLKQTLTETRNDKNKLL